MKRILLLSFTLLYYIAFQLSLYSQHLNKLKETDNLNSKKNGLFQLSSADSIALSNLPVLQLPEQFKNLTLPDNLDNSTQPYFRDLFEQVSLECGQYSSIAFNFTYEIDCRRNIPANVPENLYPTHFTFNFMNGGYGWTGVSYFHSFEIVKTNGHPNQADYGGVAAGGPSRWLSGYDKYYNGMFNKIEEVYQINAGTPEGLLTLKHWMYNHLEGAEVGGIACFYSDNPWNITTLPQGTPEGGKHVIVYFPANAGHSSTICGWNDSIRYDYNCDGQYTNDIDINGDDIVDMRDWEIGGLLFTDSYNGGFNYADSGFCYMMYKTLADEEGDGGIWNHAVHVVKVKENYTPLLAMKIKLRHTSRNKIKVITGVSTNVNDEIPAYVLGFPIFNFQGGNQYMQGGNSNTGNKTIEFGLDITPLLGEIINGQPAKFFLQVYENDPQNIGSGQIVSFSLMDYTNGISEIPFPITNVPLIENSVTTLSITTSIDFNQLKIISTGLPFATIYEPYSFQLEASGGTPPVKWNILRHYNEMMSTDDFPIIEDIQLIPSNNENGIAIQTIDFSFPFYGKNYDTLYIHTDGFIMFDQQTYPWPYLFDEQLMLRKTRSVAPFLNRYLSINPDLGDGIWYEGNENYAAFRWKTGMENISLTNINFAVIIYPTGKIEFYYGGEDMFVDYFWAAGISDGDELNFKYAEIPNKKHFPSNKVIEFTADVFPDDMSLTEDGLFAGTPQKKYYGTNIEFLVTDYENIAVRKTLPFFCGYEGIGDNQDKQESLLKIYPNPSNGTINIEFELKNDSFVSINIYNAKGQKVTSLVKNQLNRGTHKISRKISDDRGNKLQQGIYFCVLKIGSNTIASKLVLL